MQNENGKKKFRGTNTKILFLIFERKYIEKMYEPHEFKVINAQIITMNAINWSYACQSRGK